MALLPLFRSNGDTAKIIDWIGAFPPELERYVSLVDCSSKAVGKDVKKVKNDSIKPSNIKDVKRFLEEKPQKNK